MNAWSMIDQDGQRKYLNASEVDRFLRASKKHDTLVQCFCLILSATGCRISEALSLGVRNIDFENGLIVFRSLKKRGRVVFRAVPIPTNLLVQLKRWIASGALNPARFCRG
jgi:integrase/recombinase XerD